MIIFNNIDLVEFFGQGVFKVKEITGRGPIQRQINRRIIPGRKGSIKQSKRRPERILGVTFRLKGSSLTDLREKVDDLNELLYTEDDVPITFTDEPNITYFGIYGDDPNWNEVISTGEGTIYFICSDPDKTGVEKTLNFVNDSLVVQYDGTAETRPTISTTFTNAATEYKVMHQETGKFVRVIRNFVAGDLLVIDFNKEKVFLNGLLAMTSLDWPQSDFFDFTKGINTLNVIPLGVANSEATYKEMWL